MINHIRGVLKSFGARATNKAAPQFHTWIEDKIPSELDGALKPILSTLYAINEQIKVLDKELLRLTQDVYPETQLLQQVDRDTVPRSFPPLAIGPPGPIASGGNERGTVSPRWDRSLSSAGESTLHPE